MTIVAPSTESIAALAERLLAIGGSAVREEGLELTTYMAPPPELETFLRDARKELEAAAGGVVPEIQWRFERDRDWALRWKKGLGPRRVGPRVIVAPTWTEPKIRPGDVVIRIDPQMAFGTGEHATTRGVLRLLQQVPLEGAAVLDVGTGSGILSIAAVKLGADHAVGVDRDEFALENARSNVERNGVEKRVELLHEVVDDAYLRRRQSSYDVVLVNTLSGIVAPLLPALEATIRGGGVLIIAGILVEEKARILDDALRAGFRVVSEDVEDEWWSAAFRPKPTRETSADPGEEGSAPAGSGRAGSRRGSPP